MSTSDLELVAASLVAEGKGILAADESMPTIKKRFDGVGLESTEATRQAYRDLLFTAPQIEKYLSGVIMFDETIRTTARDGTPFARVLADRGIIPGIKVDKGAWRLPNFPGEKVTEGLDGLRDRLMEYREMGARFAKWRAVIAVGDGIPTHYCVEANAHALARYAALCQEQEIVPIVEPEVLMEGDHSIETCEQVTEMALRLTFNQLRAHRVALEAVILKPNMVVSGKGASQQAGVEEVAERTVRCLRRSVPAAVAGICFLSGGQSPEQATEHLNAMNALGPQPWELSFSYARALQEPVLDVWRGDDSNIDRAQKVFAHRAKCNSEARHGRYTKQMEVMAA